MLHVGFTGTRDGMSYEQKQSLKEFLQGTAKSANFDNTQVKFHHGDCIGADTEAHEIAYQLGWFLEIHPPTNTKYRAFCGPGYIHPPKSYLRRNEDIVKASHVVIGCPKDFSHKGGTWYTIDYAKLQCKDLVIIHPNGRILRNNTEIENV
jgi:hypothetical protein